MEDKIATLQEVFAEQAGRESDMKFRHPWFNLFYNWLIVIVSVLLILALVKYGADIRQKLHDDAIRQETAEAIAAERKAEEDAENARKEAEATAFETLLNEEIMDCSKALYGIHLFVEKYHYTEDDLVTYLRSAFNRVDTILQGKEVTEEERAKTLHDVLFGGQYLACQENNPFLLEYQTVSRKALLEWHEEGQSKPIDLKYQFAELREDGIWLKNDINADGYARRWRKS